MKKGISLLLLMAGLVLVVPSLTAAGVQTQKWMCTVCGYVYDPAQGDPDNGVAAGTPFVKLPEDWECPVCGASKDDFEESSD
jgi:rubredoxin